MMKDDNNCKSCGRPWGNTDKCKYCDSCLTEYPYAVPGCIRQKDPSCPAVAVIPAVTVETVDNITELANCFVHVTTINTTFYIDDKHRPMVTWAGPVEIPNYNIQDNPFKLRSQFCMGLIDGVYTEVYFDRLGVGHIIGRETTQGV